MAFEEFEASFKQNVNDSVHFYFKRNAQSRTSIIKVQTSVDTNISLSRQYLSVEISYAYLNRLVYSL